MVESSRHAQGVEDDAVGDELLEVAMGGIVIQSISNSVPFRDILGAWGRRVTSEHNICILVLQGRQLIVIEQPFRHPRIAVDDHSNEQVQ